MRKEKQSTELKQTEYTQPAMLTADLAIGALNAHGHMPDMVAEEYSLGGTALMSANT